MKKKHILFIRLCLILIISFIPSIELHLFAQEEGREEEQIDELIKMSFEELMNVDVKVDVASLFEEDELVVGSTVSHISPEKWKRLGARRLHGALNNELSVMTYPTLGGAYAIAIRGYTSSLSVRGIGTMVDGIPLNDCAGATSSYKNPNWELGTLRSIEMIKGPGSAIYGSDSFHGVLSMKTFESDKDHYSIEGAGAYPLYGDSNVKISQGTADNLFRLDFAASGSYEGDQDMEYEYNYNGIKGSNYRKNKYQSMSAVLKLGINPSKKLKIKANGYANKWKSEDFSGLNSYTPDDLSSSDCTFFAGKGVISYTLWENISIEADGFYWQDYVVYQLNMSGPNIAIKTREPNVYRGGANLTIKQPDNAWNLQWLLAYSYTRIGEGGDTKKKTIYINTGETITDYGEETYDDFERDINSIFGQLKWGVIQNTIYFLAGSRYDDYSDFGRQFTPRTGIIFLPTENSSIKALYGRAFRAPAGAEIRGSVGGQENMNIDPEIIDIYELIFMIRKKSYKANINGYYSKWKDGIILDGDQYVNTGKNYSYGGEATLFYPIHSFAVDIGFSYVHSESLDVVDPYDATKSVDQTYVAFPAYSVKAGLHYTLKPFDIRFFLNNRLYMDMKESGYDKRDPHENEDLPTYWRMDLNINKTVADEVEIYLDCRNLLNRRNYVPAIWGQEGGVEEPGISILLRASYKL